MRRLVLAHQQERLRGIAPVLQPIERKIGDQIGDVSFTPVLAGGGEEVGVVVIALAGQHFPMIETGGVRLQMPLADNGGLVAGGLQQLGHCLLRSVKRLPVVEQSIQVAVLAGQHHGAAGSADGIGHQAIVEAHAFAPDAVDIRRMVQAASIG